MRRARPRKKPSQIQRDILDVELLDEARDVVLYVRERALSGWTTHDIITGLFIRWRGMRDGSLKRETRLGR